MDVEVNLPSKNDVLIPAFQRLSDLLGPDRIIWRYDPIFLNDKYTVSYHAEYFEKMARRLKGHTKKCTISFIDYYRNTVNNAKDLNITPLTEMDKDLLGKTFSEIANEYGFAVDTCAEDIDLSKYGITRARCVDGKLIEKISGYCLKVEKDKSQREKCGCARSIDIGLYDTCLNGCKYCYANYSLKTATSNWQKHIPTSSLLAGDIQSDDIVRDRKVASHKSNYQINFFDTEK